MFALGLHLSVTESSDSPLVCHLLTSWQPSHFDQQTRAQVGLEAMIYTASQHETKQILYQKSYAGSAYLSFHLNYAVNGHFIFIKNNVKNNQSFTLIQQINFSITKSTPVMG